MVRRYAVQRGRSRLALPRGHRLVRHRYRNATDRFGVPLSVPSHNLITLDVQHAIVNHDAASIWWRTKPVQQVQPRIRDDHLRLGPHDNALRDLADVEDIVEPYSFRSIANAIDVTAIDVESSQLASPRYTDQSIFRQRDLKFEITRGPPLMALKIETYESVTPGRSRLALIIDVAARHNCSGDEHT